MPETMSGEDGGAKSMFQELSSAILGIDEAMSFAEVMKYAPKIDYFSEKGKRKNEKGKRKKESREIEAEMIVIHQP